MFSIGLRFLSGQYVARNPISQDGPEWPPHPDRLLSALIAAAYQTLPDAERFAALDALRWLAAQDPPQWAGPLLPTDSATIRHYQTYVPRKSSKITAKCLVRSPRAWTSLPIAPDTLGYWVWPHSDPGIHDTPLTACLEAVQALGHSSSFVVLWREQSPPDPTLVPYSGHDRPTDSCYLRLPYPGRVEDCDAAYQQGRHPDVSSHTILYAPPISSKTTQPVSFWGDLYFWRILNDVGLQHSLFTVKWTVALRRALLAQLGSSAPDAIHGHSPAAIHPHAAFVALPDAGHPFADGHLLGLGLWVPSSLSRYAPEGLALAAAIARLCSIRVDGQSIPLQLIRATDTVPHGLTPSRWRGPKSGTTDWESLTPVVFERHFPPSRGGILRAVRLMADHAGLPPVVKATIITHTASGVNPASQYLTRSMDTAHPLIAHLALSFDQPVLGPVLLGRQRSFGLGLFHPAQSPQTMQEVSS